MLSVRDLYHAASAVSARLFDDQGPDAPEHRPPTPMRLRIERREAVIQQIGRRPFMPPRFVPIALLPDPRTANDEERMAKLRLLEEQRMRMIADRVQARLNAAVSMAIAAVSEGDRAIAHVAIVRAADAYRQLHFIAADFEFRGLEKDAKRYAQAAEFMGASLQDAVGDGQPEKRQFDEAFVTAAAEIESNNELMREINEDAPAVRLRQ